MAANTASLRGLLFFTQIQLTTLRQTVTSNNNSNFVPFRIHLLQVLNLVQNKHFALKSDSFLKKISIVIRHGRNHVKQKSINLVS